MKKTTLLLFYLCILSTLVCCKSSAISADYEISQYTVNNFEGATMDIVQGTVTPSGLTVEFTSNNKNECIFGDFYCIEIFIGDKWYQVPYNTKSEVAWHSIGYFIENGETKQRIENWEWLYGKLGSGHYRIIKDISDFRVTGDFDKYFLAAEFTIESTGETIPPEPAANLVAPDGTVYKYRLELTGRHPNAAKDSTFIVLTNNPNLTFEELSQSMFSSNNADILTDTYIVSSEIVATDDFEIIYIPRYDSIIEVLKEKDDKLPYTVYSYGGDVYIIIHGKLLSLETALEERKISEDEILNKATNDIQAGIAKENVYRDGGSKIYIYSDYSILKCNKLDGNKDLYIGYPEMDINDLF